MISSSTTNTRSSDFPVMPRDYTALAVLEVLTNVTATIEVPGLKIRNSGTGSLTTWLTTGSPSSPGAESARCRAKNGASRTFPPTPHERSRTVRNCRKKTLSVDRHHEPESSAAELRNQTPTWHKAAALARECARNLAPPLLHTNQSDSSCRFANDYATFERRLCYSV